MLAMVMGVVLACAPAVAATADVDDFTFETLDVDYTLTRDADGLSGLRVVESFTAVFPETDQNEGMRRVIPDTYQGLPLRPHLVSVTDAAGDDVWDVETDGVDGGLEIVARGDGYVHGVQTFVFTYELDNVVHDFEDTGLELYWDVNGVGWAQPFGEVTARVHIGADIAETVGDAACYAGSQGADASCDRIDLAQTDDGTTVTVTQADVAPGETLTFAVGFEDGAFTALDTSYGGSPWSFVQIGGALAAVGVLVWSFVVRRRRLADAAGRGVIAQYEAPPGVDALESAVFLRAAGKAIPAEVLEQAVVGSIRITEGEKPRWGNAKLVAELVDPSRADADGRMLLEGIFPGGAVGDTYEFGSTDTRLSKAAQQILTRAGSELKGRGLYRKVPGWTRFWPILGGIIAAAVAVGSGVVMLNASVDPLWPVLLLVVTILVAVAATLVVARTPLTAEGVALREHLDGLRLFIGWAEADRIRMLQSPEGAERIAIDAADPRQMLHLYERLLPYAVVFGQEKAWSERLVVLYDQVGAAGPSWYAGAVAFNAASFSSGIGSLSAAAASASSSGGSTGGGSAGGGGGGGGGGGV
jgi:hypothetical protein